jgi:hypothetical protein
MMNNHFSYSNFALSCLVLTTIVLMPAGTAFGSDLWFPAPGWNSVTVQEDDGATGTLYYYWDGQGYPETGYAYIEWSDGFIEEGGEWFFLDGEFYVDFTTWDENDDMILSWQYLFHDNNTLDI